MYNRVFIATECDHKQFIAHENTSPSKYFDICGSNYTDKLINCMNKLNAYRWAADRLSAKFRGTDSHLPAP